jgi:hypothetical protein
MFAINTSRSNYITQQQQEKSNMFSSRQWKWFERPAAIFTLLLGLFSLLSTSAVLAQNGLPDLLFISSQDASTAPTIVLRAYGLDGSGNRINLAVEPFVVSHGGQIVSTAEIVGDYAAGTFTIFVLDIPPGVQSQQAAIQQAIEQFSSPPYMEERTDYVAIYQVDETQADQLLAPANFYNSIRNFFTSPPAVQTGPTALIDSVAILLNQAASLSPKDGMYTSLVVITDGTDVVSSQVDQAELAGIAVEAGIPVHTIWLENDNLQPFSHQAGQQYLAELSAGSRGVSALLNSTEQVSAIWQRITAFRNHNVVEYIIDNPTGGQAEVVLSLQSKPDVRAVTTVNIPASAPSVVINLPPESRQITLANLDQPVQLSFSTTTTWLDGQQRAITSAELIVNGVAIQGIDVNRLNRFTTAITNLTYGDNTIQVAIVDEQGQRATSPEIRLTVSEGETQLPEEVRPERSLGSTVLRYGLICLAGLVIVLLFVLLFIAFRRGRIPLLDRFRRPPPTTEIIPPAVDDDYGVPGDYGVADDYGSYQPVDPAYPQWGGAPAAGPYAAAPGGPYLEIVESVTRMPAVFELTGAEHRIGRSPSQADVVFQNDITVSRLHASLVLEGNDYRIYDENSTSGTWVNGQKVAEYGQQLIDGDEIRLGAVIMYYHAG